ncbi:hypothetical protein A4A49_22304, partial [Nicotiana attenuata]
PYKYKRKKQNTAGRKVTSGMGLATTLTNVATTANTGLELNMVSARSTNGVITNITGQNMLATATLLAINHEEIKAPILFIHVY